MFLSRVNVPQPPEVSRKRLFNCYLPVLLPTLFGALLRIAFDSRTPLLIALDSVLYYLFALDWKRNFEWRALLPFRTPVYPMLLGEAMRWLGETPQAVTIFQVSLGILTVGLVSDMARRLIGPKYGWLPGFCCAVYPTLIFFENFLLAETLTACLSAAFFWAIVRYEMAPNQCWVRLAGILGAMTALTRPTLMPLVAAPVAAGLIKSARAHLPNLIKGLPLYGAYAGMFVAPWVVYVAHASGTMSLTVATGWQLWIYQHIDQTFDDTVPSFAPYRARSRQYLAFNARYRQYITHNPEQASGWMVRGDLERELNHDMAAIDRRFMQFGLENITRHPLRYAGRVIYSAIYFLGLVPVDDQEKNEADYLIRRTLSDREYRREIGDYYMTTTGYVLPPDPRATLANPLDVWLLRLYLLFRQRGFVVTPLFFIGIWNLLRRRRSPFFCVSLLAGVLLVMLLHSLFLANLDRYHWPLEPLMLIGAGGVAYPWKPLGDKGLQ